MRNLLIATLAAWTIAAGTAQAQTTATPATTWTFHPSDAENPTCPGSAQSCDAWRTFRDAHPWPYQAYALSQRNGRIVAILSEPPTRLSHVELEHLAQAVFGSQLEAVGRYRWATGVDGWLEDLVLTLKPVDSAKTSAVLGSGLKVWNAPSSVVEGLKYIDAALHGTSDGFWLEDVDEPAPSTPIASMSVRPVDVGGWLTASGGSWASLTSPADAPSSWSAILGRAGAFRSSDGALVALVLSKGAVLDDARDDFRRFALESDLLAAALKTPKEVFVLIGRKRQIPLSDLPPLRFETFAALAAQRSEALAQSYERQRVFAGKILTGEFRGWDWAPILLSKQLEDREFGALLNAADQILKSWSEAGQVRYLDFPVAAPPAYPFGASPVSSVAASELDASGIIFNWNTRGFSVLTDQPSGRVLTADRSGALPVLYLPLGEDGGDAGDPKRLSEGWSKKGRDYFERSGHPLVVRVAQNTLLYQAVNNLLVGSSAPKEASLSRTEIAVAAIQVEAKAWLSRIAGEPDAADPLKRSIQKDVRQLLATPGMTLDQAAEFLVASQTSSLKLLKAEDRLRVLEARGRLLDKAGDEARAAYRMAYDTACAEALRHPGGTKDANGCRFESESSEAAKFNELKAIVASRNTEIERIADEIGKLQSAYFLAGATYRREAKLYRSGQRLGRKIADSAWLAADLDGIKDRLLAAAARDRTGGSIRTPTLVLSQNEVEIWAIGGHNVGGRPPIVTARTPTAPSKRMPAGSAAQSAVDANITQISANKIPTVTAERLAAGELGDALAPRSAADALQVSSEAPKSMLALVRSRPAAATEHVQPMLARLQACSECRAVVVSVGPDTFAVAKRPPGTGNVEIVEGASGLIEVLANARGGSEMVHFYGVDAEWTRALTESVMLKKLATSRPSSLIEHAKVLFGGGGRKPPGPPPDLVLETPMPGQPGGRGTVSLFGRDPVRLARAAQAKPAWSQAVVQPAEADAASWFAAHPNIQGQRGVPGTHPTVVVVVFPKTGDAMQIGRIAAVADVPEAAASGAGVRLQAILQDQVKRAATSQANLATMVAATKARIVRDLKADVTFYVDSNLGDLRMAEARP
ncbi:MAG: hypothetical protein Q8Q88_06640 [Phenylobacterium sp.]|uniref:hypothetical protein n=1 Tax=Phenylobacterium sp. TaxID=1871053 RepID=UPI002733F5C8|nr:hypothetical protein [Phenylobacterium sp.]MDP3746712.1 hypothetical protein [Phenylobacterium sp.]